MIRPMIDHVMRALGALALSATTAMATPHGTLAGDPLWEDYRARFIEPSGRTVDTANGDITHSEAQGYAMVLALAADDAEAFARLHHFTRTRMALRDDGLVAWRWEPGRGVTDPNNATDGDILIAWALHEATKAGWDARYGAEAALLVEALAGVMPPHGGTRTIQPGAVGFEPAPDGTRLVNPSYWVLPALESLAEIDPALGRVAADGEAMIARAARGGVPTDWMALDRAGTARPAPDPSGAPAAMGYNAVRLPLHLAWSAGADGTALQAVMRHWPAAGPAIVPAIVPASGATSEPMDGRGYRAVAALAACAAHGTRFPDALRSGLDTHYYPASLHLLAIVAVKERHPRCW